MNINKLFAVVSSVALFAFLTPAPAAADHGHNCVWSGGAWIGQGLCPGMPGYTPHTDPPSPEPTPEPTPEPSAPAPVEPAPVAPSAPAPVATANPVVPTPTPKPKVKRPPVPVTIPETTQPRSWQTQAPKPPGCTRHAGQNFCVGQQPPAPQQAPVVKVVVGSATRVSTASPTDWYDICYSVCLAS